MSPSKRKHHIFPFPLDKNKRKKVSEGEISMTMTEPNRRTPKGQKDKERNEIEIM